MLLAQVVASRVACCAVGGTDLPETVVMEAQSPSAQTWPSCPTSSRLVFTCKLPLSLAQSSFASTGTGAEGTVEMIVLQGISPPDFRMAFSEVAATRRSLRISSTPRFFRTY